MSAFLPSRRTGGRRKGRQTVTPASTPTAAEEPQALVQLARSKLPKLLLPAKASRGGDGGSCLGKSHESMAPFCWCVSRTSREAGKNHASLMFRIIARVKGCKSSGLLASRSDARSLPSPTTRFVGGAAPHLRYVRMRTQIRR